MSTPENTPEGRARKRVNDLLSLLVHAVVFAVVNAFLWIQDIAAGGGVEWAYWTTIPWGVGLGIHAIVFLFGRRGFADRKYQQYLDEERLKETRSH